MGRKAVIKDRILDPGVREEWLNLLVPYFLQNGLHRVKMEDVTRFLGISKATMYEHFASRDELFAVVVDRVLGDISTSREVLRDQSLPYQERYVHMIGLVLQQVTGISTVLLEDLKFHFPILWRKVMDFYQAWEDDLREFFEEGIKDGEFLDVSPAIQTRIASSLLRDLISPEFLIANNLTVQAVFIDFFRIQCHGIFAGTMVKHQALEDKLESLIRVALDKNRTPQASVRGRR